ncbi:MAG TPA: dihydropteroate synthase [Gemmatimonadaceae bacterium]|nr:dihydropteroate synthase [Gemmatimonadaceae bacterium]
MPWQLRTRTLDLDRPVVVGIVNVTPDSFSDGGQHDTPAAALAHAQRLVADGADVLDVGGESTRPQGAVPVSATEERARVVPVVRLLRRELPDVPVSVDTVKAEVAQAALDEGAEVINDVSAFRLDPRMGEICARAGCGVILMHSRGAVHDMATFAHADYDGDAVDVVLAELREGVDVAMHEGVAAARIAVDPGIGFAKRPAASLAMLAALPRLGAWGFPVLVGVSRKRFIGEITGVREPQERVHGTTGANVAALCLGARLFRVHDVRAARQALDVAWAVLRAGAPA